MDRSKLHNCNVAALGYMYGDKKLLLNLDVNHLTMASSHEKAHIVVESE
jgi:hypothetical protein